MIQKCPLLMRRKKNKNRLKLMKLINLVISFTLVVGSHNISKSCHSKHPPPSPFCWGREVGSPTKFSKRRSF